MAYARSCRWRCAWPDFSVSAVGGMQHLLRTVKKQLRAINKIAKGKGRDFPKRLQDGYRTLLDLADRIPARALELLDPALISIAPSAAASRINMLKEKLTDYLNMTIHVCDLARRRVLEGERIDNSEKLFSLFEPHTELIIRGKVPQPSRVRPLRPGDRGWRGLRVPLCDLASRGGGQRGPGGGDEAGATTTERSNPTCVVRSRLSFSGESTRVGETGRAAVLAQARPRSGSASGARGHCGIPPGTAASPGIESAIGALQSGNGLDRCRDKTFGGYCRYVGLGILGRNLQVLGKLLIVRRGAEVRGGAVAARPHRGLSWSARPQRRGGTMASTPW